jgi:hypothetical protein
MNYQGQILNVVSRDDLIISKLAAHRDIDLEDVRLLQIAVAGDVRFKKE